MLAGLALSLGYLIYAGMFSGEKSDEYRVKLDEPVDIELSPDMNPVSIDVALRYAVPKGTVPWHGAQYEGSFKNSKQTLWSGQFGISVRARNSEDEERRRKRSRSQRVAGLQKVVLETFDVEQNGVFVFQIHEAIPPDVDVESINIPLVVTGFTMFGVGLADLIFGVVKTLMT